MEMVYILEGIKGRFRLYVYITPARLRFLFSVVKKKEEKTYPRRGVRIRVLVSELYIPPSSITTASKTRNSAMCVYCLANNEQGVYRYNRSARSPHPTYLVAVFIPTHVFGVTL